MTVLDWLLASDPAVRGQVLGDLTDAPADVVAAERARVATEGWGARLLARRDPDGQWAGGACFPAARWAGGGGHARAPAGPGAAASRGRRRCPRWCCSATSDWTRTRRQHGRPSRWSGRTATGS